MKARSWTRAMFLGVLVATAIGGAAWSWASVRKTHALDSAVEAERHELATSLTQAREFKVRIAAVEEQRVARQRAAAAKDAATSAPPNAVSPAKAPATVHPNDDASRQAARLKRFREQLPLDYYAVVRARRLSEAETAQFEDILTQHEAARLDLTAAAREQGLAPRDTAVAKLREAEDRRFEAELRALLGVDGAKSFTEYRADAPLRGAVGQLAGTLAVIAEPLSATQIEQLTGALREQNFRQRPGDPTMWNAVLERAATFLSPRQLAELRQQATTTQAENSLNELQKLIDRTKK